MNSRRHIVLKPVEFGGPKPEVFGIPDPYAPLVLNPRTYRVLFHPWEPPKKV